jgi:hypothetical protein
MKTMIFLLIAGCSTAGVLFAAQKDGKEFMGWCALCKKRGAFASPLP